MSFRRCEKLIAPRTEYTVRCVPVLAEPAAAAPADAPEGDKAPLSMLVCMMNGRKEAENVPGF
jgi:hypothetical protein